MRDSIRNVGQRFLVGFSGYQPSADVKRLIRDYGVGGVVLFARNVDTPEQVAELVRELQAIARDAGHELPLLMATDQEGGQVQSLRAAWTVWPAARALGLVGSEETARRMGRAIGVELAACGIRCNFAPVLDVATNPKNPVIGYRAIGSDPEEVARIGAAVITGLQEADVAATAKHFPGHGDTSVDSHFGLPVVDHSRERLEDIELRPFRRAIQARTAAVMVAHLLVRTLDAEMPATLSKAVLGDLLRVRLGYDGVAISDNCEMGALAERWSPAQIPVLAAQAGCDLVLFCADPHAQVEGLEGMLRAVESGAIDQTEMDKACARIRTLKQRFVVPYPDPSAATARAAVRPEHAALAQEIRERSRGGV